MLWWGANFSFGETTHELRIGESGNTAAHEKLNTGEFTTPTSWFTVAGSTSNKYSGMYLGTSYTEGLKMDSKGKISFETLKTSNITIVQCTKQNDNDWTNGIRVKVGETTTTYLYNDAIVTTPSDENNSQVRVYTLTGQTANTFEITGNSESGIFYVKVVEYEYSYPDATVKSYPHTWDFTASSSDWGSTSAQVVSYDDWNAGSDNNPCTYYVTGTAEESRGFNIDVLKGLRCQSYYLGVDWGYGHIYVTAGSITIPSVPAGYRIIFTMEGRETGRATNMTTSQATPVERSVSSTDTKHTTYTFDVSSAGDVTFSFDGAISIKSIVVTSNTFTGEYTASTTTDLSVGVYDSEKGIYVLNGDDKERNLKGTYTFTGAGPIAGGKIISEVPGIKMTVGKSQSTYTWEVANVSTNSSGGVSDNLGITAPKVDDRTVTRNNNYVPTDGCFIVFEPYVNGYLTINGTFYGGEGGSIGELIKLNADGTSGTQHYHISSNSYNSDINITNPLIAGEKYILYSLSLPLQLHSFTFSPAFLRVSSGAITNTQASTTYTTDDAEQVNLNTGSRNFPHLIAMPPSGDGTQAGLNKVKFSGDRKIVNLYNNNDVDLLDDSGSSPTLIKGTVLQDGGENELFTYYYMQASLLKATATTLNGASIEDQAYVESVNTSSNPYVFTFNHNIKIVGSSNSGIVKVRIDDGDEFDFGTWITISGNTLSVDFKGLTTGSTYRIRIVPETLCKFEGDPATADMDVKNAEIVRTFTVAKDWEAPIELIYPTGIASVGTSIVLETHAGSPYVDVNPSKKVKGWLNYEGGDEKTGVWIDASYSANRLIFKPTSTLRQNTNYFLKIPLKGTDGSVVIGAGTEPQIISNTVKIDNVEYTYQVTKPKIFFFTTGAAAGSEPIKVSSVPAEDPLGRNPVTSYNEENQRISFTFDQKVELEPFSIVHATPVNGSEATVSGETKLNEGESGHNLLIDSNGKTIYFTYGKDGLKYDLFYEVVIPTNTVIGAGGTPNSSPITLKFRMAKNPNATPAPESFYPHTWDFNRLGALTEGNASSSTADLLAKHAPSSYSNSSGNCMIVAYDNIEENKTQYIKYISKRDKNYGFNQGDDISIATSNSSMSEDLPEFKGIRVSLKNNNVGRFEIRDNSLCSVATAWDVNGVATKWEVQETGDYNPDGTHQYVFRMNGNTHYMTLSNVPAGKLYMVVNSKLLGINSPNATFENNAAFTATTHDNNTRITNTNGLKKLVLNVSEAGDVVFCVGDFSCEKIGVSDYSKTFKSAFSINGKTYATDCVNEDIRPDLVHAFTNDAVKAYYITNVSNGLATATEITNANATASGAGTIVIYQNGTSSDIEVPFFVTDVNTPVTNNSNYLVGTVNEIDNFSNSDGKKYFFTNIYRQLNNDKTDFAADAQWITDTSQMGFYRAMGNVVSAHKAWLDTSSITTGARLYYAFSFPDEEQGTTIINNVESKSIADGEWYTLQGIRVEQPAKGNLYIHNGKKVFIK